MNHFNPIGLILRKSEAVLRAIRIREYRRHFRPDAPVGRGVATIAGILRSPTGVGEGARLMAAALSQHGYSVGLTDCSRLLPSDVLPVIDGPNISGIDIGGPLILHANPPAMLRHLARLRRRLRNRRILAYWAWELPVLPRSWHGALDLAHEIWVPSRFVAAAVAGSGTNRPIRVVPHPVRPGRETVQPMDIAPGRCVFLTMFSDGSGFERKNPVATIRAFRRAFGDRPDVLLIVKSQTLSKRKPLVMQRLRDAIAGAQNILVIEDALSTAERDALVTRADVMVSLHRSEGFGLTLAEAMLAGKPVVATNWSGNLDFMTAETSALIRCDLVPVNDPGGPYDGIASVWAEPDVEHAAAELARLADPAHRVRLGLAARRSSEAIFRPAAFIERVAPVLGSPPHEPSSAG